MAAADKSGTGLRPSSEAAFTCADWWASAAGPWPASYTAAAPPPTPPALEPWALGKSGTSASL